MTKLARVPEQRMAIRDVIWVATCPQPLAHALCIVGLDKFDERAVLVGAGLLRLAHRHLDEEPRALLVPSLTSELKRCLFAAILLGDLGVDVCARLQQKSDDLKVASHGGGMQRLKVRR